MTYTPHLLNIVLIIWETDWRGEIYICVINKNCMCVCAFHSVKTYNIVPLLQSGKWHYTLLSKHFTYSVNPIFLQNKTGSVCAVGNLDFEVRFCVILIGRHCVPFCYTWPLVEDSPLIHTILWFSLNYILVSVAPLYKSGGKSVSCETIKGINFVMYSIKISHT